MSLQIVDFAQVSLDSDSSKLRQFIRILWSASWLAGSAYGLEEITLAWPTPSSMILPAYFVLALAILYAGHLSIDVLVELINDATKVSKAMLLLRESESSNEYFALGNLKGISIESHYRKNPIEISVLDHGQLVRNTLSTLYGECWTQSLSKTTT